MIEDDEAAEDRQRQQQQPPPSTAPAVMTSANGTGRDNSSQRVNEDFNDGPGDELPCDLRYIKRESQWLNTDAPGEDDFDYKINADFKDAMDKALALAEEEAKELAADEKEINTIE
ncbi:hypothetical protein TgHK011_007950 [Trichoderma gracile]|nr:hypothetical protein TgHK011_007950 [Trichoderma gracile]